MLGNPVFVRGGVLGASGARRIVLPLRGSAFPDPTRLRGGVQERNRGARDGARIGDRSGEGGWAEEVIA